MTPADIRALKALAEKATPGLWAIRNSNRGGPAPRNETEAWYLHSDVGDLWTRTNGAYIAAASPDKILSLLALLDAALRENERLRKDWKARAEELTPIDLGSSEEIMRTVAEDAQRWEARAIAAEARALPTREEIAGCIMRNSIVYEEAAARLADAILALLKGEKR